MFNILGLHMRSIDRLCGDNPISLFCLPTSPCSVTIAFAMPLPLPAPPASYRPCMKHVKLRDYSAVQLLLSNGFISLACGGRFCWAWAFPVLAWNCVDLMMNKLQSIGGYTFRSCCSPSKSAQPNIPVNCAICNIRCRNETRHKLNQ